MKRVVIMASSYETVCYPASPSYRVVSPGGEFSATVPGAHRASLVASLTRLLAEHGVALEHLEQAEGEGCFSMVGLGRVISPVLNLAELRRLLDEQGKAWGVSFRVQREELFLAMHRI